jgi:hypothetical protein
MGGRRLTETDKKLIRELYVNGVNMDVIAERVRTTLRTVSVYTQGCGDREYSVFRDGTVHNGKRGRKRSLLLQPSLF